MSPSEEHSMSKPSSSIKWDQSYLPSSQVFKRLKWDNVEYMVYHVGACPMYLPTYIPTYLSIYVWRLDPGHCTCQTNLLPLSHISSPIEQFLKIPTLGQCVCTYVHACTYVGFLLPPHGSQRSNSVLGLGCKSPLPTELSLWSLYQKKRRRKRKRTFLKE